MPADRECAVELVFFLAAERIGIINTAHKVIYTLVRHTHPEAELCLPRLAAASLVKMVEQVQILDQDFQDQLKHLMQVHFLKTQTELLLRKRHMKVAVKERKR